MSRVIQSTVYSFKELSDSAKDRVRDWYCGCIESDESDELTDYDDWQAVAAILGVTFKTKSVPLMGRGVRHDPCIWWSGFSSQGDGASFEGSYTYAKGAARKIRDYAPTDKRLHAIADDLQNAQRLNFYRLEASVTRGHGSNFYSHSGTMSVEVWDREDNYRDVGDAEEGVREALRDFANWIYAQLEAQRDYLTSDEAVDESILANGYEFTEDGQIA